MEEKKERLSEIMAKYLAGEASSEETADLIAWLEADRRHAREFSRLVDFDRAACPPFDPAGIREEPARERVLAHVRRDECRIRRMNGLRPCYFYLRYSYRRLCSWVVLPQDLQPRRGRR